MKQSKKTFMLLILPALVVYLVFMLIPLAASLELLTNPLYIGNHLKYNGTFLVKINRGHYNEKSHGLLCYGLYHSF